MCVCGPSNVKIHRGIFYFIIFIDDFSRYGYVYLILKKSDALDISCGIIHQVTLSYLNETR